MKTCSSAHYTGSHDHRHMCGLVDAQEYVGAFQNPYGYLSFHCFFFQASWLVCCLHSLFSTASGACEVKKYTNIFRKKQTVSQKTSRKVKSGQFSKNMILKKFKFHSVPSGSRQAAVFTVTVCYWLTMLPRSSEKRKGIGQATSQKSLCS